MLFSLWLAYGQLNLSKGLLSTAYAGSYDDGISTFTVLFDKQVLYVLYTVHSTQHTLLTADRRVSYLYVI